MFEMLRTVGLAEDVTRFGLHMIIPRDMLRAHGKALYLDEAI